MQPYYSMVIALLCLIFTSCSNKNTTENKQITNPTDYEQYLNLDANTYLSDAKTNFEFWTKKLDEAPSQHPFLLKIAGAHTQLFKATGKIDHLINAEKCLVFANKSINYSNSGYLRSLAHNYISQHRFKEALQLIEEAEQNGDKLQATQKMLFDVLLEIGNDSLAASYLENIRNENDFDYLIRLSKLNDHKGNLDQAIKHLEKAISIAEQSNNKGLMQWGYSNIGDYYGHAGRIQDSYNHYLKALQLKPNDAYALKGIAWIVYSYERNADEALRIIDAIQIRNSSPDYYLLKAEIEEYAKNIKAKQSNLKSYWATIQNTKYGAMYNKYNVLLFADDTSKLEEALTIANIEVANRPTAQSYDLLAWSYFKKGELKKALQIANLHVAGKTFEPEVLYHLAEIYKANDKANLVAKLKAELLGASYELGPVMEQQILKL